MPEQIPVEFTHSLHWLPVHARRVARACLHQSYELRGPKGSGSRGTPGVSSSSMSKPSNPQGLPRDAKLFATLVWL
jgi:hypothetical protein